MSEYVDFVRDFATRTRENLEFIRTRKDCGANVNEVTQLINSLLGMLIFIQAKDDLPEARLEDIPEFPDIRRLKGRRAKKKFSLFIKAMRDAIAHGQIKQTKNKAKKITGFEFWTTPKKDPETKIWHIECSLDAIYEIAIILTKRITR